MSYSKSIKKWKKLLITWIKESDDTDDAELNIIRQLLSPFNEKFFILFLSFFV